MRIIISAFLLFMLSISCADRVEEKMRVIEDFNKSWKFNLGDVPEASKPEFEDSQWKSLSVPHDWSIEQGYQKDGTASSTGFVEGGIGWYRKSFVLSQEDQEKNISVLFDGVYNNSSVWINGHLLGTRPYGYSSFAYDLTDHLKFDGSENTIAVKVDHSAYADSRWYTGSGIYRKVQLIKTSKLHIALWGVQITTPRVSHEAAEINIVTKLKSADKADLENIALQYVVTDHTGVEVSKKEVKLNNGQSISSNVEVKQPKLWGVEDPNLYNLKVTVLENGKAVDEVIETFGIRTFEFDANKGFSLNGESMKIKGVNLHHDAGAVGAAVPKALWEYRMQKLKSIGVNAVRLSHNPHSVELMEVCDEMGLLVMNEAFDEWDKPKGKSVVYLGDNAASEEASRAYPEEFNEWAERDLKDLVLRDFNHPSVIMWSIGNEIEWTFPHYSKTFDEVNKDSDRASYAFVPDYDSIAIKKAFEKNIENGIDPLATRAKQLVEWVKEVDTSRPVTCGSVLPSIGMVSGYGTAVDVYGFNYRLSDYDIAHKTYPDLKILGSENWGAYNEWKSCIERDFVSGIFAWTGFAYIGEAGPWPRKGLEISFFDFAGFKTARGHFFECLWVDNPKVYMVTTPVKESEYSYSEKDGWKFEMQLTPAPVWNMLRKWEWYKTYPKWKYEESESIVVQTYTNCEEAELFLNGVSIGKQKLSDFSETDNIIKWLVPYKAGELKVVGYNQGEKVTEYILNTNKTELSKIEIEANKSELQADGYDVTIVSVKLLDENGNLIIDGDREIEFQVKGEAKNLGVDNGWEMNVQPHKSNVITTHNGRAILILQSTNKKGNVEVSANNEGIVSNNLSILSK